MPRYVKLGDMKLKVRGRAWAILMPRGMGKYSPVGEFVGWKEKILKHYAERGEEPDFYQLYRKFTKNLGPLKEWEMPEVFRLKKNYKDLASMIQINGLIVVDEELKNFIERFDEGIHQFFPIRIECSNGERYPKSYHGLIILQWKDSFLPALSGNDVIEGKTPYGLTYYSVYDTKKVVSKLTFSMEKIGDVHLWRECRLRTPYVNVFMSDQLATAIDEAGLDIFRHHPVRLI